MTVRIIDTWTTHVEGVGFPLTVIVTADGLTRPEEFDCFDADDIRRWRRGEWRYVTVTVSPAVDGVDVSESLSGTEWGRNPGFSTAEIGRDQINAYPVKDLAGQVAEQVNATVRALTARNLTAAEQAAEVVAVALKNDRETAERVEKFIRDTIDADTEFLTGEHVGQWIRTAIVGEETTRTGRADNRHNGAQLNQDTPQALVWASLIPFVDWPRVGQYFLDTRDS